MPILFNIIRSGNDFFCSADGEPQYFVGRRVPYEGNIGLYNIFRGSPLERLLYSAGNYTGNFGFWAEFIEPTALCEGRSFLTLNSYDRAAFTFGFAQFAAHVPDGDFVTYFRTILGLPEADDYFPNLALISGRIHRTGDPAGPVPLESATSTAPLMKYLNPTLDEVEDSEVIAAAKLIRLTSKSRPAREAQVERMVATFRELVRRADARVGLDSRTADQCCVVADILHQGRGGRMTWPLIQTALRSTKPLDQLLAIGEHKYASRIATLRAAIRARPVLKSKKWSSASNDFV
jgi:hypothetical protein